MSDVTVKTKRYEARHGDIPRGTGYWWFETKEGNSVWQSDYQPYREAESEAIEEAEAKGLTEIYVCP
jgi:hypothetical protein